MVADEIKVPVREKCCLKRRIYFNILCLKIHNITPPLPCYHRKHGLNRKLEETALRKKCITVVSWRKKSSRKKKIYSISENTLRFAF